MSKLLTRIAASVLTGCLLVDPSLAAAHAALSTSQRAFITNEIIFSCEALSGSPVESYAPSLEGTDLGIHLRHAQGAKVSLSASNESAVSDDRQRTIERFIGRPLDQGPVRLGEVSKVLRNLAEDTEGQLLFLGSMMIAPSAATASFLRSSPYGLVQKMIRERAFRLIERKISLLDPVSAASSINLILTEIRAVDPRSADSFFSFIAQISRFEHLEGKLFTSLTFTEDSMHWPVLRGLSLTEARSIVENGELVNMADYGTFSVSNGESTDMVQNDPGESFQAGREIMFRLRVPRWLLGPANYDFGLIDWNEDQADIASRHLGKLHSRLEEARAFVTTHHAEFRKRQTHFREAYQARTNRRIMSHRVWVRIPVMSVRCSEGMSIAIP